jgi:hypothetical protein
MEYMAKFKVDSLVLAGMMKTSLLFRLVTSTPTKAEFRLPHRWPGMLAHFLRELA